MLLIWVVKLNLVGRRENPRFLTLGDICRIEKRKWSIAMYLLRGNEANWDKEVALVKTGLRAREIERN
jgi:hypothetical protein